MPKALPQIEQIEQACLSLLTHYPDGLSEYQLLNHLRSDVLKLFPALELNDQLGLFQHHFLLFHTLYRLRDRLHRERTGSLAISALTIVLHDYGEGEPALAESDPLRDYYLDLSHLANTTKGELSEMLNAFWRRMLLGEPERVAAALEVLELESAGTFAEVKQQYKRLVMAHHPDRGGEDGTMHALNQAMAVMRAHFNQ